jgi:hypothetical protein
MKYTIIFNLDRGFSTPVGSEARKGEVSAIRAGIKLQKAEARAKAEAQAMAEAEAHRARIAAWQAAEKSKAEADAAELRPKAVKAAAGSLSAAFRAQFNLMANGAANPKARLSSNNLAPQSLVKPWALREAVVKAFGNMAAFLPKDTGVWEPSSLMGYHDDTDPAWVLDEVKGTIQWVHAPEDVLGLRAKDRVAATILFQQIVGVLKSQVSRDIKLYLPLDTDRMELVPGLPSVGAEPMACILTEDHTRDRYNVVERMIRQRLGLYNAEWAEDLECSIENQTILFDAFVEREMAKLDEETRGHIPDPSRYAIKQLVRGAEEANLPWVLVLSAFAQFCSAIENPDVVHLCDNKALDFLMEEGCLLDHEDFYPRWYPENLATTDCLVIYPMDYEASVEDARWFFELLAQSSPATSNGRTREKRISVTQWGKSTSFKVNLEGEYFVVHEDGTVEDEHERRVNSTIFVSPLLEGANFGVTHDDVVLVNPIGNLIWTVAASINHACNTGNETMYDSRDPKWGKLFTHLTSEALSIDSEEQSGGCSQGDRLAFLKGIAKPYTWNGGFAWKFPGVTSEEDEYLPRRVPAYVNVREFKASPALLTTVVREKYNMTHTPKAPTPFCDGRLVLWGLVENGLPIKESYEYAEQVVRYVSGKDSLWDGLVDAFPEMLLYNLTYDNGVIVKNENFYEALDWGLCNYAIVRSTRKNKADKRAKHRLAKHARPIGEGATDLALVIEGQTTVGQTSLVHELSGIYARAAVYPAGQSLWINPNKKLPAFAVPGSKNVDYPDPSGIQLHLKHSEIEEVDDKHVIYHFNQEVKLNAETVHGAWCNKGDAILTLTYEAPSGKVMKRVLRAPHKCVVTSVSIRPNDWGDLKVSVKYEEVQRNGKYRGNLKTMVVRYTPGYVYNRMNSLYSPDLKEGVDFVVTGDADKSPDLDLGPLEVVAQTLRHTPEGREQLNQLNRLVGVNDVYDYLNFSPRFAGVGGYDALLKEFYAQHLRSVWFQLVDVANNYIRSVWETYANKAAEGVDGWSEVSLDVFFASYPEAKDFIPTDAKVYTDGDVNQPQFGSVNVTVNNTKVSIENANVMVFFNVVEADGTTPHLWQRTASLIPTEAGDLKIPVKVELSTVDQAVGNLTRFMNNSYRLVNSGLKLDSSIEGKDNTIAANPALARALAKDTSASIQKWVAFKAMANNVPIFVNGKEEVRQIPLIDYIDEEQGKTKPGISAAVKALFAEKEYEPLVAKAVEGTLTLEDLAKAFKDVAFQIVWRKKYIQLYLPAIVAQDAKPTSRESLSGMVEGIFAAALTGQTPEKWETRVAMIAAFITKIAESEKAAKRMNSGRLSAQTKAQSLLGIDPKYVYVLRTDKEADRSFYASMAKSFKLLGVEEFDGYSVLVSRSPIPVTIGAKVKVVDKPTRLEVDMANYVFKTGDTKFMSWVKAVDVMARYALTYSQPGMSPLIPHVSGGDNDGDIYVFTPIEKGMDVTLASYDVVMDILLTRTGVGATAAAQGSYIVDHCFQSGLSADAITNPRLVSKTNVIGFKRYGCTESFAKVRGVKPADVSRVTEVKEEDGFDVMAERAIVNYAINIGSAYGLAVRGESAAGVYSLTADALKQHLPADELWGNKDPWFAKEVALRLFEYYEGNPLGGYSHKGWEMTQWLATFPGDITDKDVSDFRKVVKAAGMNPNFAREFLQIAIWARQGKEWATKGFPKGFSKLDIVTFLSVASELTHLIGRGKYAPGWVDQGEGGCKPNPHLQLAGYFMNWNADKPELWAAMRAECVTIAYLRNFISHVTPAMCDNAYLRKHTCDHLGIDVGYADANLNPETLRR